MTDFRCTKSFIRSRFNEVGELFLLCDCCKSDRKPEGEGVDKTRGILSRAGGVVQRSKLSQKMLKISMIQTV